MLADLALLGGSVSIGVGTAQTEQAILPNGERSHAGHHPSDVASGWGSPVSAASAAATSARLART